AAQARDRDPAEPGAEKGADLMRKERQSEERGEVADAEELADDRGGRRHGGEPREAEPEREEIEGRRGLRGRQIKQDQHGARAVHQGERELAAVSRYRGAGEEAAGDVREADDRERPTRDRRRQSAKIHLARKVRHQECYVEAASEESGVEQEVAAIAQRTAHRAPGAFAALVRRRS